MLGFYTTGIAMQETLSRFSQPAMLQTIMSSSPPFKAVVMSEGFDGLRDDVHSEECYTAAEFEDRLTTAIYLPPF